LRKFVAHWTQGQPVEDFSAREIDARVRIQNSEPGQPERPQPAPATQTNAEPIVFAVERQPTELIAGAAADAAFRVSRLLRPNSRPLSVSPDCTLNEAVTLMLRHNYSQLPVMTNERDVKGIVSGGVHC
jgi:CBS domain-containing protein